MFVYSPNVDQNHDWKQIHNGNQTVNWGF